MKESAILWYALRVTYSREVTFKQYLDKIGIENFIPMHYTLSVIKGKRYKKLVPAIHNLIFVRAAKNRIDDIKRRTEDRTPVRYIFDKSTRLPVVVPCKQMEYFIAVSENYEEPIVYLDTSGLKKGDRVRITGGPFRGIEGEFMRIRGDRRVVVNIEGVMAVATTFIHSSMIKRINA